MSSRLQTTVAVAALAVGLLAAWPGAAAAQSESDPTGPFGPFAGYTLDPLSAAVPDDVPPQRQPDWSQLPAFNTYLGGGMLDPGISRFVSVAAGTDAGAQRVYVASSTTNRIYVFDGHVPINPASPPQPISTFGTQPGAGTLQGVAGISFYNGEVYAVDRYLPNPGQERVVVYGSDGAYKRSFPLVNPRGIFDMTGVDVMAGEVWVTGELCGGFGGVVEIYDSTTGALKAVVPNLAHAPTGSLTNPCDSATDASSWWDMAAVPEMNAAIAQYRLIDRGLLAPLSLPDLELQCLQCFRRLWQDGTDAVPGMRWFLSVDGDSATVRGTGITEFTIDPQPASGEPFLLERRRWFPKQAASGGVRDIAYQKRETRIDWDGNLTQPDWQHNDSNGHQCLQYVVSDADIFLGGDKLEHWWDLAKVQKIEFYVDGTLHDTILNSAIGTYCLDEGPPIQSGVHDLKAKAYVEDGAKVVTADNPDLHIDHDVPTGTLNPPGQFARGTVTLSGSMADAHSGARDWQLQANGPGTGGAWQSVCDPSAADVAGGYGCQWDTTGLADGVYQLRAKLRDKVDDPFGGPNVGYSPSQSVTVDNTPPAIDNVGPNLNELGEDNATDVTDPVLWTQTDATSGVSQGQAQVNDATDGSASGAWHDVGSSSAQDVDVPWNTTGMPPGLHRIRVQSRDRAGNGSLREAQFVLSDARRSDDRQWLDSNPQASAAAICPGGRCYASVYPATGHAATFGIQGTLRVPGATVPLASRDFSADWVGVGAWPETAQLQGGYDSSGCARNYRQGWFIYSEMIRISGKRYDDCPSPRSPEGAGQTNSFSVRVYRDPRRYEARIYRNGGLEIVDDAPHSGRVGQYWIGKRGRRNTQATLETSRRGMRNIGYFSGVQVSYSDPDSFENLGRAQVGLDFPYQIKPASPTRWCASGPKPGSGYSSTLDCTP